MNEVIQIASAALSLALAAGGTEAQIAMQPVPIVGDIREYQTFDDWTSRIRSEERHEVIGVLPDFMRVRTESRVLDLKTNQMEMRGPEDETMRADLNIDYPGKSSVMHRVNYAWPLSAGKKWSYEYALAVTGGTFTYKFTAEAVKWETVMTPAGTFRAIRVDHKGIAEHSIYPTATSKISLTMWYSPEAKTTVKTVLQADSAAGAPGMRNTTVLTQLKLMN